MNTNEIKALRLDEPSVDEQQVTSKQVAREANVSQSTVSLVLSGKAEGRVSLKTRQLVEETARRMGYRPNLSARSLRTGVSMTIALAVPDVKQPFFGEVLYAAEKLAASKGYSVILVDTSSEPLWAERIVQMIESMTIAGCIVYACDRASDKVLARTGNKIIYIEAEDSDLCHIDLNASSGIEQVLQHLTLSVTRKLVTLPRSIINPFSATVLRLLPTEWRFTIFLQTNAGMWARPLNWITPQKRPCV